MTWHAGETWYRVVGDLAPGSGKLPVLLLHGGPGATHDYLEPMADLAGDGRAVVLYDQLGNGNSSYLPDAPAAFWTPALFKEELVRLAEHLGVADRYAVIGQSWGGMLAMEHALDHPAGLVAMVVADSPSSMAVWVQEANRLRADLPPDVQAGLLRHEQAGTTDDPEYAELSQVFYDRHVCRVPMPDCVQRSFALMASQPTVYHTMNGPSEFHCIGSLRTWDITPRLHEITTPTLLVSGRHDEATPLIVGTIHDRIAGSRWRIFEESSHMPHVEEPDAFLATVEGFLAEYD
jgi:L-proline amide hydrolase